jgi:hypothetical protein
MESQQEIRREDRATRDVRVTLYMPYELYQQYKNAAKIEGRIFSRYLSDTLQAAAALHVMPGASEQETQP